MLTLLLCALPLTWASVRFFLTRPLSPLDVSLAATDATLGA